MIGGWEQQAAERKLKQEIAKQQQKQAFWNALGGVAGSALGGFMGRPPIPKIP